MVRNFELIWGIPTRTFKDLKEGDYVIIRKDLEPGLYGEVYYHPRIVFYGYLQKIVYFHDEIKDCFKGISGFLYSNEMIDWDETNKLWDAGKINR